jgi:hypothetical protein
MARSTLSKIGVEPADVSSRRNGDGPIITTVTLRRPIDLQAAARQLRLRVGIAGVVTAHGADILRVVWPKP